MMDCCEDKGGDEISDAFEKMCKTQCFWMDFHLKSIDLDMPYMQPRASSFGMRSGPPLIQIINNINMIQL